MDIPNSNAEFANRLIKLAEDFDKYDFLDNDGDDYEVIEENRKSIQADLINHNDTWIRDWINDIKEELNSKIDSDGAEYIGHYLTECDILLQYLDK